MPELPEVEAARRAAQKVAAGRRIVEAHVADDPIVFEGVAPARFRRALVGRRVKAVRRHGKHLWLELDRRPWPCLHFGMTGGIHVPTGRAVRLVSDGSVDRPDWPPRFTKLHLRFAGGMPNYGLVRVELPQKWFEQVKGQDFGYVNHLSRLLYDYRCRDQSYGRAAISLHPTVRAEQSLAALFQPLPMLMSRFYRMAAL